MLGYLLIIFVTSCYSYKQLNNELDKSQNEAISTSPFQSAKSLSGKLVLQKKQRGNYLQALKKWQREFPSDTLILSESYNYICIDCPAEFVFISSNSAIINFKRDFTSKSHQIQKVEFETPFFDSVNDYYHSDFAEIYSLVKGDFKWNESPKLFGVEDCFDGSHTLYSVIYPNGNIESMYMRCWINKEHRKEYMK